jgi:CheY-like chemotaxis protein
MKKILIGDDELATRMLYQEVLGEAGYQVVAAKDGREAYEKFLSDKPDLVILDIKMPKMHGLEVLERIRQTDKRVPVIISTAYQKMEDDTAVSHGDVACFLSKPVDIRRLRQEVGRLLEESPA